MSTTIYTDGACINNPGPGGWAWAIPNGPYASGAVADTTNNRMELIAALEGLRAIEGDALIMSDSTYVEHELKGVPGVWRLFAVTG